MGVSSVRKVNPGVAAGVSSGVAVGAEAGVVANVVDVAVAAAGTATLPDGTLAELHAALTTATRTTMTACLRCSGSWLRMARRRMARPYVSARYRWAHDGRQTHQAEGCAKRGPHYAPGRHDRQGKSCEGGSRRQARLCLHQQLAGTATLDR